MVTTIQINEKTLLLLKKLKEETKSSSYDETINKVAVQRSDIGSMAGFFGKKYGKVPTKEILKELKNERKKSDRI